jgi:predicted house-cleaning noncanonical NTP pyrophosphatase (MazG superfamily)
MSNILTCVYCGHEYPEGTPPHGSQILTDHIRVCEKHPLREAEFKVATLRKALEELVGASTKQELEQMEMALRLVPGIEQDKITAINAIHALLKTL